MYRSLDSDKIISTADKLQLRIAERFPDSGLHRLSLELLTTAREARQRAYSIEKPIRRDGLSPEEFGTRVAAPCRAAYP